ncbi:AraC-like DNA-binding protein [Azospirillum picis]|nr:AraC-like DNA-binding protein [Azospirillum picis]
MGENHVKVWRAADLYDAELLRGVYVRHSYPWHAHEDVCLGLVIEGAIDLQTRGRTGIAERGSFVLINSEELHRGQPADPQGWRCRTIHIHPDFIRRTADDIGRGVGGTDTVFRGPTFQDAELASLLLRLHLCSETGGSSLDQQSQIVAVIAHLLARHAEPCLTLPNQGWEPIAIRRARAYLDEHLSDKTTLDDLAAVAGLPPFRLLRAFRRSLGLTPHAYQVQARVRTAHRLLRVGSPLADVAAAVGFSDQAHMTRVFKGIMGATPGQYRNAVRGELDLG